MISNSLEAILVSSNHSPETVLMLNPQKEREDLGTRGDEEGKGWNI